MAMSRLLVFLALLLAPTPALAWWDYGHRTIATIAMLEVRPQTRAAVQRLVARGGLLETPTCQVRSLEDASVWPDCVRSLRDRFSHTSSWHYQNVNVCRPFDQEAACKDGNCVSAQIERMARLLGDETLPVRERVQALAFLTHFVGDMHMPLHAGDRNDRGGNQVEVSYGLIGGRTNLHSAWDGYLAERAISTPAAEARGLLSEFGPTRSAMRAGTVTDWARESWEISRQHAYGSLFPDPCNGVPVEGRPVITEATTQSLIPTVRVQIARAGVRLARMLDEALAS